MEIKSSTLNKIMMTAIAALLVICVVLCIKIRNRPRIAMIEDAAAALGIEQTEEIEQEIMTQENQEAEVPKKQIAVTTSRVNVRNIDSEDGKVLTTVEAGAEFDFVEVLGSGWTKVIYEGQEAYIISECVTLREVEEEPPMPTEESESVAEGAEPDAENDNTADQLDITVVTP